MAHLDADTLAVLALGEQIDAARQNHLRECAECRAQLAEFTEVVGLARAAERLESPAESVWEAIAAEIDGRASHGRGSDGRDVHSGGVDDGTASGPDGGAAAGAPGTGREAESAEGDPAGRSTDAISPSRPWWRRPAAWAVAAAFVLGAATGVVIDRTAEQDPPVVATAELEPLPEFADAAAGTAQVHQADDRFILRVDLDEEPGDGFREVWLIDLSQERLISLGVLAGTSGTFDLPAGIDLQEYALVDVSAEPFDGDPAHSGVSIVRGELTS